MFQGTARAGEKDRKRQEKAGKEARERGLPGMLRYRNIEIDTKDSD